MSSFVIASVHDSSLLALLFANPFLADKWMHIANTLQTRQGCR